MKSKTLYRINYITNSEVYELYAKAISSNELLGFISLLDLVFEVNSGVVIDPIEERLKTEFSDVRCLHIPIQNVLKIEEVEQKKSCKIKALKTHTKTSTMPQQPGSNKWANHIS